MKTSSSKNKINNIKRRINRKLKGIDVNKIARQTGFQKREARKITPIDFLESYFQMALGKGSKSLRAWALKLSIIIHNTVSVPALLRKMKAEQIEFLKKVLEKAMNKRLGIKKNKTLEYLRSFKNILLQDSICLALNKALLKDYPGSSHHNGNLSSIVKIHVIYNLVKGKFKDFRLSSFRQNDLEHSEDILLCAKKGDLVLRDLGYFVLDMFREMNLRGIFFVARYKPKVKIYDENDIALEFHKYLKGKSCIDKWLRIGRKQRLSFRVIAIKLPPEVVEQRKRNLNNRRYQHSKIYMQLLNYAIFITNVKEDELSLREIIDIYKLRWRIETIFKFWKSNIKLTDVKELKSKLRVDSYIYCMLIYIVLFVADFSRYLLEFGNLSLMKFTKFMTDNFESLSTKDIRVKPDAGFIKKLIEYFCQYDRRTDRLNFNQTLYQLC